ncbi:unnamed protein product [Oncorhynchus mykiss]|uniref:C2H2-type domain-containing protein n=1 Tax=Oncorhynchus mykiss TaxID=8022 RepID=A0A060YZD0_ONCMY|nr:unnamed protein product [Oncorhynchus mykiss]
MLPGTAGRGPVTPLGLVPLGFFQGDHVETFSTSIEQQQEDHRAKRSHHCPHCEEIFPILSKFKIHLRIHKGGNLYFCTDCEKNFTTSKAMTVHQRVHTGEKPYFCSDCGNSFSRRAT